MSQSRVKLLRKKLTKLNFNNALTMLNFVMKEMSSEAGYSRHNGSHYYYHLVDVALIILNSGIKDEITITAGLGHDLFEDVPSATYHKIVHMFDNVKFGVAVADIMQKVTKDPTINYKGNLAELNKYLQTILVDWRACVIKIADRIHNIRTLKDATAEKKMRQANETEAAFFPFCKECRNAFSYVSEPGVDGETLEAFFSDAKTRMEPHIEEIKEHYEEVQRLEQRIKELEAQLEQTS